MPIKLRSAIICDDHYISIIGIDALLKRRYPNMNLWHATSGEEALRLFHLHGPDLILIDMGLPTLSGLDVVRNIRASSPTCGILILTGSDDKHLLQQAVQSGANGVLRKLHSAHNIESALDMLTSEFGESYIDPAVKTLLGSENGHPLSKREYEVMNHIVKGLTGPEIADVMGCSLTTVKTYRARILNKSGCRNSAELMAWYLKRNKN